jgi:hypothetical protein
METSVGYLARPCLNNICPQIKPNKKAQKSRKVQIIQNIEFPLKQRDANYDL